MPSDSVQQRIRKDQGKQEAKSIIPNLQTPENGFGNGEIFLDFKRRCDANLEIKSPKQKIRKKYHTKTSTPDALIPLQRRKIAP